MRKKEDRRALLRITADADCAQDLPHIADAFLRSLSFLSGHRQRFMGYEHVRQGTKIQLLFSGEPPKRNFWYRPLPSRVFMYPEAHSDRLLELTTSYLLNGAHASTLADVLWFCLDAADNDLCVKALVAATTVEAMAEVVCNAALGDEEVCVIRRDIAQVRDLVRGADRVFESPGFQNRLLGLLDSMAGPRAKDRLKALCDHQTAPLSGYELKAYGNLRNRLAHGKWQDWIERDRSLQTAVDELGCVASMVNKLALFLVGYEGPYVEYSEQGWPERRIGGLRKR